MVTPKFKPGYYRCGYATNMRTTAPVFTRKRWRIRSIFVAIYDKLICRLLTVAFKRLVLQRAKALGPALFLHLLAALDDERVIRDILRHHRA